MSNNFSKSQIIFRSVLRMPAKKSRKRTAARMATTSKKSKFDSSHYELNQSWDVMSQVHLLTPQIVPDTQNPIRGCLKRIIGRIF